MRYRDDLSEATADTEVALIEGRSLHVVKKGALTADVLAKPLQPKLSGEPPPFLGIPYYIALIDLKRSSDSR
jgi:hypothetical protein